ncbi:MAG TPA: ABC transporter permease, partial [Blastocatellia bacterium]|nr:ABC transporter permease [Blastocatellia bacterium]
MRWFRLCYLRLYGLLFKKQVEQDIDEEMAFHIRMLASQRGAGEASEDAARSAARRFGRIEVIKDYCRDIRGGGVLDTVLGDLRYGLRSLGRNPGFAAVAISTLALGIGANTALFSVLNSVLLRPLPYTQPERLVSVQERDTIHGGRPTWISYPDFFDWRASSRSFDHIVGYRISSFNISLSGSPAHVGGAIVSWDLFPLLGMQPELGRGFTPEEEEPGHLAAVLSHELWQGTFGGDRDIIGKSITVGGRECSIVGVAPLGFRFPAQNRTAQLWTTIGFDAQVSEGQPITEQRGADLLEVTARLKPGVTFQQANDEMNTVAANLAERYPNTNRTVGGASVRPELERVVGANRQPLLILMGAVGLVLLIASANIANLLLARSVSRRQEMAIRAALGAARARVIGQLLTETLLLAFFGCVCGLLLAWLCLDELLPLAGNSLPRIADTTIDIRVLAFSVGVALIAALLSGSAPAVQASKVDLTESLKENGRGNVRGHDRLGGALIV